jgi:hypothetical protein
VAQLLNNENSMQEGKAGHSKAGRFGAVLLPQSPKVTGLTAQSATKLRSSSSIDQWRTARPERNRLEKIQPAGPRMGNSSLKARLQFTLDQFNGATSRSIVKI